MKKELVYHFPKTVKEAVKALSSSPKSVLLAGGTHIVKTMPQDTDSVVDIRDAGLNYIRSDARWLVIGAGTTFTEMMESADLADWAGGILRAAASSISSHLIRNMGTVGGNIVRPFPYNHFPSVLLALNAKLVIAGKGSKKTVACADMTPEQWDDLGRKSMLVEIRIPAATKNWKGVFEKFAKTESMWESYALVTVAMEVKGKACKQASIALGSALPKAARFQEAEALLAGKPVTEELAAQAAESVASGLSNVTASMASKEYKAELVRVLVKRNIMRAYGA